MLDVTPQRINRDRLYEQVAARIQELILSAGWPAGSKMPSERELGEQFGVSRTVIREALKALSERGLVNVSPGRGIFVVGPSTDALADSMRLLIQRHAVSHGNLVEARRLLEIQIAGLAAQRSQPTQVEKMRVAIQEMDSHIDEQERFIVADQAFHFALAEATQNTLLPLLVDSFAETLAETRRMIFPIEGTRSRGQDYHRRLLNAVVQRDATQARKIMDEHLKQFEEDVRLAERSR